MKRIKLSSGQVLGIQLALWHWRGREFKLHLYKHALMLICVQWMPTGGFGTCTWYPLTIGWKSFGNVRPGVHIRTQKSLAIS